MSQLRHASRQLFVISRNFLLRYLSLLAECVSIRVSLTVCVAGGARNRKQAASCRLARCLRVLFVCLLPPLHKGALLVARHKMLATRGPRLPAWVAASIAASLLAGFVAFTPVPRKPLQEEGVRRLEQHHAKTMAGAARSRSPKRMSRFLTASCTSTAN